MNTFRNNAARMFIVLCIGALLLTGVVYAQDAPDVLPATGAAAGTANAYVTQLDELRAMGQPQAERITATAAGHRAGDFSSDLQALNELAIAGKVQPTANDYITMLDQLRSMAAK
jgi:hypothetical protein